MLMMMAVRRCAGRLYRVMETKVLCRSARLQWGVRFVRAAWRLGSAVDEVGEWIAKVVLVINLVVRTEKKVAEG